jgi:hypothetical protein
VVGHVLGRGDLHVGQPQVDGDLDVDLPALGRRLVERHDHHEPVLDEPQDVPLAGQLLDQVAPVPQLDPEVGLRDLASLDGDRDVGDAGQPQAAVPGHGQRDAEALRSPDQAVVGEDGVAGGHQ